MADADPKAAVEEFEGCDGSQVVAVAAQALPQVSLGWMAATHAG